MIEITSKKLKRKDKFYLTFTVTNGYDHDLVSVETKPLRLRPSALAWGSHVGKDPRVGRSEPIEHINAGESVVVKITINASELYELGGSDDYTLHYGLVQEHIRWHQGREEVVLSVPEMD